MAGSVKYILYNNIILVVCKIRFDVYNLYSMLNMRNMILRQYSTAKQLFKFSEIFESFDGYCYSQV